MDSTHGAAAGVGGTLGSALTAVLASTFHWDVSLAANWVVVIMSAAGFVAALVVWWVKWKWPSAPPLPGELVEVPPGAPVVRVAQVAEPGAAAPPAPVVAPPPAPPLPPAPPPLVTATGQPLPPPQGA